MKTAVLVSGGVDSAVALTLLKEAGYDVTAYYLRIWLQDEFTDLGDCPWEEDILNATRVCEQTGVELKTVSLQTEYWERVVSYTIREIQAGRTPNPDIFCNSLIKFGEFYKKIDPSYQYVATGHYAQVEERDGITLLKRSPDPVKDQTYFLSYLTQEQLRRALFPIGSYSKREIRSLAEKYGLYNKNRKDSQGICFLGQIKFRDFIRYHLGDRPGHIIDLDTGKVMGEHKGYYYYTIGQRSGLGLGGGPWYVVKKDSTKNHVYISKKESILESARDSFTVSGLHWITGEAPKKERLGVKIRHAEKIFGCTVTGVGEDQLQVRLDETDKGIAEGQFAVFYDGEYCLGAGVISS